MICKRLRRTRTSDGLCTEPSVDDNYNTLGRGRPRLATQRSATDYATTAARQTASNRSLEDFLTIIELLRVWQWQCGLQARTTQVARKRQPSFTVYSS